MNGNMKLCPSGKCPICNVQSTTRCSNCNQAFYCSVKHQKSDWKLHKKACTPFKVSSNDKLGRFLVATRDIKAGEIVLKESPLVRGPSQLTAPVCLGCLQTVDIKSECESCGWPMCSQTCAEKRDHQAECRFTVESRGEKVSIQHVFSPHPTYQCLHTLRCLLLKDHASDKWKKLCNLESHCEQRTGTDQWRSDHERTAQFIKRFFKCDSHWTDEEILKIAGIIQVNGHEVPLTDPPHTAIYEKASMLEHSCLPNLAKSFTNSGDLLFWAPKAIENGNHLSISYTDALWPTGSRRNHLHQTKMFECECARCQDPTEMGTYFSAIRCDAIKPISDEQLECSRGLLVAKSTKNLEGAWQCTKCERTVEFNAEIGQIVDRAAKDLQAMNKNCADSCAKYIAHYGKWLPSHHFLMCEVRITLAHLLGSGGPHIMPSLSDGKLAEKIILCRSLLKMLPLLAPAEVRLLGSLNFELHAGLAELGRREAIKKNSNFRGALEDSILYGDEAIRLLSKEPTLLPEGNICAQAKVNVESLRMMIVVPDTI